jgi:methionine-rich copper-binding protein CopC
MLARMAARIRFGLVWVGLLMAVVLALILPAIVAAHAEIKVATPAGGATVTTPVSEVSATYTEALDADSRLVVVDGDGVTIARGAVDPADDRRMVAKLDQAYVTGTFTVRSTAIALDGHVERATWTFTVAVPATPTPTPLCTDQCPGQSNPPPSPSAQTPSPTPAPTVAPSAGPQPSSPSGTSDAILPIVAALAIVVIGAGALLGRGRRAA